MRAWSRAPAWVRWSGPVLVMAVLWWSSSRAPTDRTPSVVRALFHNGMHVVAYAVLAASWYLALVRARAPSTPRASSPVIGFAAAVGYGLVDELHQSFVGRTCSAADVLTDALGAVLGLQLVHAWWTATPMPVRAVAAVALASCGSVAVATFGPW